MKEMGADLGTVMGYMEAEAKKAGVHLIWEGKYAGPAKDRGYTGDPRYAKGGGVHAEYLNEGQTNMLTAREKEEQYLASIKPKTAAELLGAKYRLPELQQQLNAFTLSETDGLKARIKLTDDEIAYAKTLKDSEELQLQLKIDKADAEKRLADILAAKQKELNDRAEATRKEREAEQLALVEKAGAIQVESNNAALAELQAEQEHNFTMRSLTDLKFDDVAQAEQRLADEQAQLALVKQQKADLLGNITTGKYGTPEQVVAAYSNLYEAEKAAGMKVEEGAAYVARALKNLAQATEDALVGWAVSLGKSLGSGDFASAMNTLLQPFQDMLIDAMTRVGKRDWGGNMGEAAGGALGGGVGALIGSVVGTFVGKLFKKGRKGGIVVEQAEPFVVRPEDPNITLALPSSYFFSGRGMPGLATAGTSATSLVARQVASTIERERRRGQNW
jgi:hypothetical protein